MSGGALPNNEDQSGQRGGQVASGGGDLSRWRSLYPWLKILFLFFLVTIAFWVCRYHFGYDLSKSLVVVLVASTIALTVGALWMGAFPGREERRFLFLACFPAAVVVGYCFLWTYRLPPNNDFFWFAIITSLLCVVVVFIFVYHMMVGKAANYSTRRRFSLLLLGFSWFLSVTLLLGLAIGFHDRKARQNVACGKQDNAVPGLAMLVSEQSVKRWLGRVNGNELEAYGPFYIWFYKDSATVKIYKYAYNGILRELLNIKDMDELKNKLAATKHPKHPLNVEKISDIDKEGVKKINANNFAKVVRAIMKCNENNKGVHLLIKGLASKEPPDKYPNNFALSHTRALQTADKIFALVNEHSAAKSCALPLLNSVVFGSSYDVENCGSDLKRGKNSKKNGYNECISAQVWIRPYTSEIKYLRPPVKDIPSLLDYI